MTKDELDSILGDLSPARLTLVQQAVVDAARMLAPQGSSIFEPYKNDPVGYARDVLRIEPWSMQEEVLRLVASPPDDEWHCKLALGAGTSSGKCVAFDERIPLADGRIELSQDLIGRYFVVLAWDGDRQIPSLAYAADNGVEEVWKIITHSGRTIIRTANHPLYTANKRYKKGNHIAFHDTARWAEVRDLKVGDSVLVPLVLNQDGKRRMPDDHVKLLGYFLGDGGTTTSAAFTQMDGLSRKEFIHIVKDMGCRVRWQDDITFHVAGDNETSTKTPGRNPVLNLIKEWGLFGVKSKNKKFPEWVWELPNDQLSLLLNRLFACYGWAYGFHRGEKPKTPKSRTARIGITLASEKMIRDVEWAMIRLGVNGKIRPRQNKCGEKRFSCWEWVIYEPDEIIKFAERVGIYGKDERVKKAVDVVNQFTKFRRWRKKNAPDGYRWDTIRVIEALGKKPTVAIAVPGYETFVTTFVEHNTCVGGTIVNWFYDCRGPCIIPTTAPSQSSVVDLLWKEVRIQRARAAPKWGIGLNDFIGPQAPAMKRGADWWAKGFVSQKSDTFKGRHTDNMCFLFDEAPAISQLYFDATKTMFQPGGQHLWICLYNPTDRSSPLFQEIFHPESDWYIIELSSLEHPNLLAELRGEPRPISAGVSLAQLQDAIKTDCEEIHPEDRTERDFEWPPNSGRWYRPNSHAEWAFLGRWPTGDDSQLWSDALWKSVTKPLKWEQVRIAAEEIPRIGHDCGTGKPGSDKNETHVSWGDYSVYHESKGLSNPMKTCGRLIELVEEWARRCNESRAKLQIQPISPKLIPIMIDDDGVGCAISCRLREQGYRAIPVGAATKARRQNRYPNKRSELWFDTAERGRMGKMNLGLLPRKIVEELRRQAMAPTWENDSAGRRVIEEKEKMRQRLGRSPDGADSMHLSYYVPNFTSPEVIHVDRPSFQERMEESRQERRGPNLIGGSRTRTGLFRRKR